MTLASRPRVLVTGSTGRVGRLVVDELLQAGVPVRALTRRPDAAGLTADVELVSGDLTVPDSLDDPLRDVSAVFLVWTAPPATLPAVIQRLAASPRRVVLLSSPHQTPHPFFQQPNPMAALHAGIERQIADAGLDATILRPGMFASNSLAWWAASIRAGGVVRWPYGDVETAPIDERDIAAVAARALCDERHAGRDYVLTGPESLSQREQVSTIGDAIGRTIRLRSCLPRSFAARWLQPGRVPRSICCSPPGAPLSASRRTYRPQCSTSLDRLRGRFASGRSTMRLL